MRRQTLTATIALLMLTGCSQSQRTPSASAKEAAVSQADYAGFDRNEYPGDDALPALRKRFAFTGYWLNNPPGARHNPWLGKREILRKQGFGFLVLANGRLGDEIVAQTKKLKLTPQALGKQDAEDAIAAARREGFPERTILFLDQEEGGRLLAEAAAYFFSWTETVAHSAFRPGAYASGQPSQDGTDAQGHVLMITTAQNIQEQIAAKHLSPIALFVYQDACPPSNGCTVKPPPLSQSGTPGAMVWQYAQSPRRPNVTRSCAKTYDPDGSCYALPESKIFVDLSVASSPDPSHGR